MFVYKYIQSNNLSAALHFCRDRPAIVFGECCFYILMFVEYIFFSRKLSKTLCLSVEFCHILLFVLIHLPKNICHLFTPESNKWQTPKTSVLACSGCVWASQKWHWSWWWWWLAAGTMTLVLQETWDHLSLEVSLILVQKDNVDQHVLSARDWMA